MATDSQVLPSKAFCKLIDPQTAIQIEKLLAEGQLTNRQIAKECRVAHQTVNRMAGLVPDKPSKKGPIGKCENCGFTGEMPCKVCPARRELVRNKREKAEPENFGKETFEGSAAA